MKRALNIRLEESLIIKLNQLSAELNTTKTDIIEKAINMFAKKRQKNKNNLLKYAGILKESEADKLLESIQENKDTKEFELNL